ncbi:MAG: TolC family protein, partial [Bacteroidales bacterium]|nr:TolC family protein [Bacteroidales bacterium]
MKRITIFLAIILFPIVAKSQDLQLQDCVRESLKNNPLSANKALTMQIAEVKGKILKSAWLPGIDINAQSTWQSDVVTLEFDLPFAVDFPKIPKDQYKVTTDISQLIYDGGSIHHQQVLEKLTSDLSVKELEKGELDLKSTVEDLYFAILVAEKRIEVLNLMTENLQSTVKQIESGVKNGLLSESDLPVVIAEQIKTDQQMISLKGLKQRAVQTLSILMGREISLDTRFLTPVTTRGLMLNGERPEYGMFELQGEMLTTRKSLLNAQLRPKVFAFGQAGYGKPGLNFMG